MTILRRVSTFRIDAHERVGKRLRVDGHFSRTGIQVYSDGAGRDIREYRPPEEVFADTSLASLRGMPVTVRHPRGVGGFVTPENWRQLASQGVVVGQTGDTVGQADDGRHTSGSIWLHDSEAIRQVEARELRELSVGYTATLDETPGVSPEGEHYDAQQRNILGNHIALLGGGEARGGPTVRILDAAGHVRFDDDDPPKERNRKMKYTITLDGLAHEVELPEGSNFPTAWEKALKERAAVEVALEASQAKTDGLAKDLDVAKAALAEATDPKHLAQVAGARAKLLADAVKVAGQDVPDEGDALSIRRAALQAAGIDVTGKTNAYVEARFDHEAEAPEADHTDAVDKLRGGDPNQSSAVALTDEQKSFTTMGGR